MVIAQNQITYESRITNFKNNILGFDTVDQKYCDTLTDSIVGLESKILSLGPSHYKEAPVNSITTRHEYYNLIDFLPDQIDPLLKKISTSAKQIISGEEFYVKMWANIFRRGERIEKHMHHASPIIENEMFKKNVFKTICGNLFLKGDAPSDTVYYGKDILKIPNKTGDIHFFSCIMPHETLPYQGELRVGIAFDIYTKNFFPEIGMVTPPHLRLIS
jgi:hypothetical protein